VPTGCDIQYFEFGSGANALGMGTTAERPVLLRGSIPLQQESLLDDLFDLRFFPGKVPLGIAARYSEPSHQKQHAKPLNSIAP